MNYTGDQERNLARYQAAATSCGAECTVLLFPCISGTTAIVQAAEEVDARVVIARIPESIIPFRKIFLQWTLKRRLMIQAREWVSLDSGNCSPQRIE